MYDFKMELAVGSWVGDPGCVCCQAQQNATGTQTFGSFSGGPDTINLGNLDVNLVIPILQKQGRGIPFVFNLTYDSSLVWLPVTTGSSTTWTPQRGWGWPVPVSAVGYVPAAGWSVNHFRAGILSKALQLRLPEGFTPGYVDPRRHLAPRTRPYDDHVLTGDFLTATPTNG